MMLFSTSHKKDGKVYQWYAWRPTECVNGDVVWLEWVTKRYISGFYSWWEYTRI